MDRETFDELYAAGRREAKRETRGTAASHDRHIYFKRALREYAGERDAADALAIGDAYWEGYASQMELCDGVERVFDALTEAGTDVAIVTNLTTRVQLQKLSRLAIDDRIDRLVTSEEVGREKPSAIPSRPRSRRSIADRARRSWSATTSTPTWPARTRSGWTRRCSSPTATRPPTRSSLSNGAQTTGRTRSAT